MYIGWDGGRFDADITPPPSTTSLWPQLQRLCVPFITVHEEEISVVSLPRARSWHLNCLYCLCPVSALVLAATAG